MKLRCPIIKCLLICTYDDFIKKTNVFGIIAKQGIACDLKSHPTSMQDINFLADVKQLENPHFRTWQLNYSILFNICSIQENFISTFRRIWGFQFAVINWHLSVTCSNYCGGGRLHVIFLFYNRYHPLVSTYFKSHKCT